MSLIIQKNNERKIKKNKPSTLVSTVKETTAALWESEIFLHHRHDNNSQQFSIINKISVRNEEGASRDEPEMKEHGRSNACQANWEALKYKTF